ncbi:MAG: hypothetical protein RL514_1147 [Verrucomicrobiota bacterium]|jgi:nucleoside-diphosphate-sugar epimerase
MKILVLGTSSFAAHGLAARLTRAGHEVWTFNRSRLATAGPRDLHGSYERAVELSAAVGRCDALINYAIAKFGGIEENLALADQVIAVARAREVSRVIHVSSISVLPAVSGPVDETTPAVAHRWKGEYSKVKVAVERRFEEVVRDRLLLVVRPGFIIGPGLADSLPGIARLLPTGHLMGLGNRHSIIPLVAREHVHEAVCRLVQLAEARAGERFMLVSPDAPTRAEYLAVHCRELGRGQRPLHFPAWLWRVGLAGGSVALTLLKRRPARLVKLFEHNLNVRTYDCTQTKRRLGLDFRFDWPAALREVAESGASARWPVPVPGGVLPARAQTLHYVGLGRIVQQKHLPGLARNGFTGRVSWTDPALTAPPAAPVTLAPQPGFASDATHAVITAPSLVREGIYRSLPATAADVLVEKPFAVSRAMLDAHQTLLAGRRVFVVHNYRLKPNVLAFRRFLAERPPGALRRVTLHFDTPSPHHERAAWQREEWRNRILLTDYAIHYLDLAWLLFDGPMTIRHCERARNARGELARLAAEVTFPTGVCSLFIRQGAHQRQCSLRYVFDHYAVELRFYPDVFEPLLGGQNPLDDLRLFADSMVSTAGKVMEKLRLRTQDHSHDLLLGAFTGTGDASALAEFSLPALRSFYERLTLLADEAYRE